MGNKFLKQKRGKKSAKIKAKTYTTKKHKKEKISLKV